MALHICPKGHATGYRNCPTCADMPPIKGLRLSTKHGPIFPGRAKRKKK